MIRPIRAIQDKLNEFFSLHEFECKDGLHSNLINPEVLFFILILLTEFRIWYNRIIVPFSAFRTEEHNAAQPGASPNSKHLRGVAVDIHFPVRDTDGTLFSKVTNTRREQFLTNVTNKWFDILTSHNMTGGVGWYDWGFHLDAGNDTEYLRLWDYRDDKYIYFHVDPLTRVKTEV